MSLILFIQRNKLKSVDLKLLAPSENKSVSLIIIGKSSWAY